MADTTAAVQSSREVRVFISSTFRDFLEERELLAKQVFPALNRRARERGVEVVDVDLRWGVTQEQVEDGHALEICLQEIERCRPYFIGLLGDSYGSLPQPSDGVAASRQWPWLAERPWLAGRIGEASYTDLEVEHSLAVLSDPAMAGRAFFYFRDPAYSDARAAAGEEGWRSKGEEERDKLVLLRQKIRQSPYPLVDGLLDPQAIAAQIEADLWALIDQQFPEDEQPDALEKEARKHADYRRSRTGEGRYIGGQGYIDALEQLLAQGEQQILITGESGGGKSALIANWLEQHVRSHPQDVVYAHHLGCTNDANALKPLLGRLIDTGSTKLLEADVITEALAVPEDWWELVARVAETLHNLSRWCKKSGKRWIWVLDGLDRLDEDDQTAMPWLPQSLPAGVHVITSALECRARTLLSERQYTTLAIEPLAAAQQEQLIQQYLQRYTKQLDGGLQEQILNHKLAGSPLFLKVLLEELRQCGRFDTLTKQLKFYLSAESIDDLYERVLERLENDGSGDAVRKVMTTLWASRAGVSETELLAITDLVPLQWAPIDLALEQAFGRNGNRLVFDHDFLRKAVEDRYLPPEEQRRQAHSELADWYQAREGWDERDSEELPWQLQEAGRLADLRGLILGPEILARLQWDRGSRETINYWLAAREDGDGELDELIADDLDAEIEKRRADADDLIWFVERIAGLFDEAGLYREPLLKLRTLSLELEEASEGRSKESMLCSLVRLASAQQDLGNYDAALPLYERCLEARERLLGREHPDTLITVGNLAGLLHLKSDYEQAEAFYMRALEDSERLLSPEHPSTLSTIGNLGLLFQDKGDYEQAEALYMRALQARERLLGPEHPSTLTTVGNLAGLLKAKGDYEQAEALYMRDLEASERLLGPEHPSTITTVGNLGLLFKAKGDYEQAEVFYMRALESKERLLGPEHPSTLTTVNNLAGLVQDKGDYEQAEALSMRALEARERLLGPEHPDTLTTVYNLAELLSSQGRHAEAIPLRHRELAWCREQHGDTDSGTLASINGLAIDLREAGELEEAETLFRELVAGRTQVLEPEDFQIGRALGGLAKTLELAGKFEEALHFSQQALNHRLSYGGPDAWWTNLERLDLARVLHQLGRQPEAMALLQELQVSMSRNGNLDDNDSQLINDAAELLNAIEAAGG